MSEDPDTEHKTTEKILKPVVIAYQNTEKTRCVIREPGGHEPPGRKEAMKKCKRCVYRGKLGDSVICNYILVTGHRRESDINHCDKFIAGKARPTMDNIERLNFNRRKQRTKNGESKLKKNRKKKAVILTDPQGRKYKFESITEAGKLLGKSIDAMNKAMKKGDTIYGYKWKWSDENLE